MMKESTMICLGVRHVGRADLEDEIDMMTVKEAILKIAKNMICYQLGRRMEFVVGRDQMEILNRFNPKNNRSESQASIEDELAKMFEEFE